MNVTETTETPRPRRRYHKVKRRKTDEFSIVSAEHQRLALEALEEKLQREPLKWKQVRLRWMVRRLNATLEVHGRKRHAR